MKEHKNIDQLLNDLDEILDINDKSSQIDFKELSKKHHEKINNERKAISKRCIFVLSFLFVIMLLPSTFFIKINIAVVGLLLLISFWLNNKAHKEIKSQNLATSHIEFKKQKKKIAQANLKLFQRFRIIFYTIQFWGILSYSYDYISDPNIIKLVTYLITLPICFLITYKSIEDLIKEQKGLIKAQD